MFIIAKEMPLNMQANYVFQLYVFAIINAEMLYIL